MTDLQRQFGNIDIYLFDQLLRGRLQPGMRILDAGCGGGRNLVYLIAQGYEVFAVDESEEAINKVRQMAPNLPAANFRCESIESMSFPDQFFDFIIAHSVLHFAHDDIHFEAMLSNIFDKLKIGGILFCRLASTIGIEHLVQPIQGRRQRTPDGGERYLVDVELLDHIATHHGEIIDPIKTTIVNNQRSMTTWVIRRTK